MESKKNNLNWDKILKSIKQVPLNQDFLKRVYLNADLETAATLILKEYSFLVSQMGGQLILTDRLKQVVIWLAKYLTGRGEIDKKQLNKGLLFIGDVGTGKTTLMLAVVNVIENYMRKKVRRYHTKELILNFSDNPLFIKELEARPVFIDDIGKEDAIIIYGNKFFVIEDFVAHRYDLHAWTFFTTNLSWELMLEKYGAYVMDRLVAMCNILTFKGKSFRS